MISFKRTVFVFFVAGLIYAGFNLFGKSSLPGISNIYTVQPDKVFRSWLHDTLPALNALKNVKILNVDSTSITVGEDSLTMEVAIFYSLDIKKSKKIGRQMSNVIELLKEYAEFSHKIVKVRFIDYTFYQPSSVEQSRFDFSNEIKALTVSLPDSEITYNYIRGRLSGKKVKFLSDNSIVRYDFAWDKNKLVKYKIGN